MKKSVRNIPYYVLAGCMALNSCIDEGYDWNNGVDLSVNVGGKNLTIPIGKTDSLFLKSFLDSTDMLKVANGVYCIEMHGREIVSIPPITTQEIKTPVLNTLVKHTFDFFDISSVEIADIVPMPQEIDLGVEFNGINVQLPSIQHTIDAPLDFQVPDFSQVPENMIPSKVPVPDLKYNIQPGKIVINLSPITLPNMVEKVNYVKLASGSKISLVFSKSNFERFEGSSKVNSLKITLPKLLVPASNPNITEVNGEKVYTLTNLEISNGTTVDIPLDHLDLSAYTKNQNGQITISSCEIKYEGVVGISGQAIVKPNGRYEPFTKFPEVKIALSAGMNLESVEVKTERISSGSINKDIRFDINQKISSSVSAIESITFGDGCILSIDFAVNQLPASMLKALKTNNLEIQFPQELKFATNQGVTAQNKYVITSLPFKKDFALTGLQLNKSLTNGVLDLRMSAQAGGEAYLEPMTLSTKDLTGINDANFKITTSVKRMTISDAKITSTRQEFSKQVTESFGEIKIDVPAELKKAYAIWTKGGDLKVDLKLKNYPESFPKVVLDELKLKLPDFLYVNGQTGDDHNVLIYKDIVIERTGKLFTIHLDSIYFNTPITNTNNLMVLSGDVEYIFKAHIPSANINIQDIKDDLEMNLDIVLPEQIIQAASCQVETSIKEKIKIELGDIPDLIKDQNNNFDLTNTHLMLNVASNLNFPIDAVLDIVPYFANTEIANNALKDLKLGLPGSRYADSSRVSYWLGADNHGMPQGYTFIQADINKLLKQIPDYVEFAINAAPKMGTVTEVIKHYVDLNKEYGLSVGYDLVVPLNFGSDFRLGINDILKLDKVLTDEVLDMIFHGDGIALIGTIYNSIPLNLSLKLMPMDENDQELTGIQLYPNKNQDVQIQAGYANGSESTSNILIEIKGDKESLKKLSGLKLMVEAKASAGQSTNGGGKLTPENYLRMGLKAKIKGGININPDNF